MPVLRTVLPVSVLVDVLTGRPALHVVKPDSSLPPVERTFSEVDPCLLCDHSPDPASGEFVNSQGHSRPVGASTPFFVTVPNRFSTVSSLGGVANLILAKEHVTSLEELPSSAHARELGDLIFSQLTSSSFSFLNVGAESGASQPHLHAHLVEPNLPLLQYLPGDPCRVCLDLASGFPVLRSASSSLYVPSATPYFLELRVASSSHEVPPSGDLLALLFEFLTTASGHGFSWPYTVLPHRYPHPHLRVLLRWDKGLAYQESLGLAVVPVDLANLADRFASWF